MNRKEKIRKALITTASRTGKIFFLIFIWALLASVLIPDVLSIFSPVLAAILGIILIFSVIIITLWIIVSF